MYYVMAFFHTSLIILTVSYSVLERNNFQGQKISLFLNFKLFFFVCLKSSKIHCLINMNQTLYRVHIDQMSEEKLK